MGSQKGKASELRKRPEGLSGVEVDARAGGIIVPSA